MSKVYALDNKNYRESYKIFACNGFCLITKVQEEVKHLLQENFYWACKIKLAYKKLLGNLNAKRDWGHAKDFVKAQWLILQQKNQMIM